MKKTSFLCIICAVVFSQFVFSADLEICFNSEINKYYEKFNKKNGLEKQFVYIDFYPDGLIKDIVNKTSVIDAYYNNNQTINRENDMIKIIFNSNFIISIKLEDDYIIVTKDYFGKQTENKIVFSKDCIAANSFSINYEPKKIYSVGMENVSFSYSGNELVTYFKNQIDSRYIFEQNDSNYIVSCWKADAYDEGWDLMFENSYVTFSKQKMNIFDKRINYINHLILKEYNSALDDILFVYFLGDYFHIEKEFDSNTINKKDVGQKNIVLRKISAFIRK